MSQKFDSYLSKLIKFYSEYKDDVSLKSIDAFVKDYENAEDLIAFRDHPHQKRIMKMAIDRYKTAAKKLTSDRKMTLKERELVFIDMDWAQWYISALGGDPVKAKLLLENELEDWINRLGIV